MANGIELASAYVRLIPTTDGIGNAISEALGKETAKAGASAGKQSGKSFLGSFGNAMGRISNSLKPVGEAMTKSLTVPIAGLATAAMASWKQVDDGLDIVVKKTGATGNALHNMQESVRNIATTMPASFKEAGTAIGEVNTRFGLTGKQLEGVSTQFLKFAKINGVDVNSSIDKVQKTMSAFGVSSKDTGAMLDTLNKVGQDTGISMDVLEQHMITNAMALRGMGLNAASSAKLLGNLEKSGVDVSTAMQGLKKVQASAMSEGISMQEAFKKALSSSKGAISVFGAKAGPQLYSAFKNGTLSADMFTNSSKALNDSLGSVSNTFDATLDPADQWQTVLNSLMSLGHDIAETLMPSIQTAVNNIIPVVKGLTEGWNGLDDSERDIILTIAGVLAAIGPVTSVLSGITGAVAKLSNGLSVLMSHPILAAIGAVIVALTLLYQNNEDFRKFVNEAWTNIKNVVGGTINAIAGFWNSILKPVLSSIGGAVMALANFVLNPLDSIKNTFLKVFNGIKSIVSPIINWLKGIFSFKWNLPKIKLPHFKLEGSFSLMPPKVPRLSIDWYAKAMDKPYLLDGATIFGSNGNSLLGGGEKGREVIMSESYLRNLIEGKRTQTGTVNMGGVTIQINGYNKDPKELAEIIEEHMVNLARRKEMAFNV